MYICYLFPFISICYFLICSFSDVHFLPLCFGCFLSTEQYEAAALSQGSPAYGGGPALEVGSPSSGFSAHLFQVLSPCLYSLLSFIIFFYAWSLKLPSFPTLCLFLYLFFFFLSQYLFLILCKYIWSMCKEQRRVIPIFKYWKTKWVKR